MNDSISNSDLNNLIPAEIKNDEFYLALQKIAREENIKTVLEIGSSSGEGSTEALVTGLRDNPNQPTLFCMEISKTRFSSLQKRYENESFVKCYNVSSISLKDFPEQDEIIHFYNNTQSNLNFYPLHRVLSWLLQDIEYVKSSGVPDEGIKKIKQENAIDFFDLVLIDGSEFTGSAEFEQIYGASYILLDDINTFKNYSNIHRLFSDSQYTLITINYGVRNGYAIFKKIVKSSNNIDIKSPTRVSQSFIINEPEYNDTSASKCTDSLTSFSERSSIPNIELPIHFFTIVLNGEPFIRYHAEVFKQLPFQWHWHIVEGVADLKHDTAWSLQGGGHISHEIHRNGYSHDGTTEYLDELAQLYPDNITIYRKPEGVFWDGKLEMVNAPLQNIQEECLLWQVDVDELWTVEQIWTTRQMFIHNPDKTAAFYWCWYFVGENLIISTRNCYAQNPQQEWLRTWRFKPRYFWAAHEPPILVEEQCDRQVKNVATINPFLHEETEHCGLVFQHFAYVTQEQLRFKEQYYGYRNAVLQWTALQEQTEFPVLLRDYFPWVRDLTLVDAASSHGIVPIAQRLRSSSEWRFLESSELQQNITHFLKAKPVILIDGVFFQLYKTGIARVWKSLLEEWAKSNFAKHIILLDRGGTAPKISGIRYVTVPYYDYSRTDADREMLQQVCDAQEADVFISSYYTTPTTTPSVFLAHDMIPELMGADLDSPMWREKHYGIRHASAFIAVSENTARDLVKFFPEIPLESIAIAKNGVNHQIFFPESEENINSFKRKYGISKPYFMLVGGGGGYKNSILFFKAFAQLFSKQGFEIVATGVGGLQDLDFRTYTSGTVVHTLQLSDEELATAYSGAVALVYPSIYEGFGLPILEAMACACPVITCPNASLPEVADKAALYVNSNDVEGLASALCEVQKPNIRQALIASGLEQARVFSWLKMAEVVSAALIDATLLPLKLNQTNFIIFPDWSQPEDSLGEELQRAIAAIATHPEYQDTTLLIDTSGTSYEDAELLLSSVTMNLLMEEDLDVSEGLEISLIGDFSEIQWRILLPRLHGKILLTQENKQTIVIAKSEKIPVVKIDNFKQDTVLV